ncbi:hypothetical protein [Acidovorax sp.]|uniref:hypothetical protein n=1 Tax=Acidovorax sp. TaxID=1872122 RepID=UPI00391F0A70
MTLKDFFKASARTAVAIFLALLALTLAVAAFTWGSEAYEKQQARPFEAVKEWKVNLQEPLSLDLRARTKLVDRKLLSQIEVTGFPPYLSAPKNSDAQFTIEFVDSDGFRVFAKAIKVSEFTKIVGKGGEVAGLEHQFDDYLALDAYKRFGRLQVGWTLDVKAAAPTSVASTTPSQPTLDHCAPGLAKAERLRRLAHHGTVREAGNGEYTAGGRSVYFMFDGSLINCR